MAGWHHWLDGCESQWTPGVGDGQGGLACCDSWGRKESDTTEQLNWTELNWYQFHLSSFSLSLFFFLLWTYQVFPVCQKPGVEWMWSLAVNPRCLSNIFWVFLWNLLNSVFCSPSNFILFLVLFYIYKPLYKHSSLQSILQCLLSKVFGFPRWPSDKESACQCTRHRRLRFDSWVRKITWMRKRQPTPVFVPVKSHEQRKLSGNS